MAGGRNTPLLQDRQRPGHPSPSSKRLLTVASPLLLSSLPATRLWGKGRGGREQICKWSLSQLPEPATTAAGRRGLPSYVTAELVDSGRWVMTPSSSPVQAPSTRPWRPPPRPFHCLLLPPPLVVPPLPECPIGVAHM